MVNQASQPSTPTPNMLPNTHKGTRFLNFHARRQIANRRGLNGPMGRASTLRKLLMGSQLKTDYHVTGRSTLYCPSWVNEMSTSSGSVFSLFSSSQSQ